jgi:hypothetical protein
LLRSATAAAIVSALLGCGDRGSPGKVAEAAGAERCEDSGYTLALRAADGEATNWSCTFANGTTRCFTYDDEEAEDATDMVRQLWRSAPSSRRPACLG